MRLSLEGQIISESRRLFAMSSLIGHSKQETVEDFCEALDNDFAPAKLAQIAELDQGLSSMILSLANKTLKNRTQRPVITDLKQAMTRIGAEGCKAALLNYRFEIISRNYDEVWRVTFNNTLNVSYRAAAIAKVAMVKSKEAELAQQTIMITVFYATSIFAKIMACQSLNLPKTPEVLSIIKKPDAALSELIMIGCKMPQMIIDMVDGIERHDTQYRQSKVARRAWQVILGESTELALR